MKGRAASALVALFCSWLGARPAGATEPPRFSLQYAAPSGCPTREAWLQQLARRSPRAVLANADAITPILVVSLTEVAGGVQAELTATEVDGRETRRTLVTPTCQEAVEGSAWILALWLDPSAVSQEPGEVPAPATPAKRATEPPPPAPAGMVPSPIRQADSGVPALRPVRLSLSAQIGIFFTALPDAPLGFAGFLEAAWLRHGFLQPVVRVGGFGTLAGTNGTERGNVRVSLASSRAVACPVVWPSDTSFALRPCAFFELGRLAGRGENTVHGRDVAAFWRSLGMSVRATLDVAAVLTLEAEAGLTFPLLRDRFVFAPAPALAGFATPAVGGTVSLGANIHFSADGPRPGAP